MFLEVGGVGVRAPGQLGVIEGHLRIGCVRSRLGASVTLAAPPLEAAGPPGPGPGPAGRVRLRRGSRQQGGTVLFPFEASPGPRPHPQLMLFDLHLFLHGHAK